MRVASIVIGFAVVALVASPFAGAIGKTLDAPNTLVVLRTSGGASVLAWTPAPEAALYVVYRGEEPDAMREIGRTTANAYQDSSAPGEFVYYRVVALDAAGQSGSSPTVRSGSAGSCLSTSSTYHVSVNVYNCISWVP